MANNVGPPVGSKVLTLGGALVIAGIFEAAGAIIAGGDVVSTIRSGIINPDLISDSQTFVWAMMAVLMAWAFAIYLLFKGLSRLVPVGFGVAVLAGLGVAVMVYFGSRTAIVRRTGELEHSKEGINRLFGLPLIFAAALLSFAHGSNDVANAVGPLAAIVDVVSNTVVSDKAPIPFWVMGLGAMGIVVGLALFGPRVIRTVGSEITELDPMRA